MRLLPVLLTLAVLPAQDLTGSWQGTLQAGTQSLRLIFDIAGPPAGPWTATLLSLDQSSDGIPVSSVTRTGTQVTMAIPAIGGTYEGTIDATATRLTGQWKQGAAIPLELTRATPQTAWDRDRHASPHTIQLIPVDKDVQLEVLDWGGTGRPLVLLTGLGNNAHVFDKFAARLTPNYHVYGITRRGFGASSRPETGYEAERLADDVVAVLDALKLTRPILAGHSIAGQELSSISLRYPQRTAALIYLDAAFPYAFYDSAHGDYNVDLAALRTALNQITPGNGPYSRDRLAEIRQSLLPAFERSLKGYQELSAAVPEEQWKAMSARAAGPRTAILNGVRKHTRINGPVLAIFATSPKNPLAESQAKALESALPAAKVVRLPNADHYVFNSNPDDVLREMNAFIAALPAPE